MFTLNFGVSFAVPMLQYISQRLLKLSLMSGSYMPVVLVMEAPERFHRREAVNFKNYAGDVLLLLSFS